MKRMLTLTAAIAVALGAGAWGAGPGTPTDERAAVTSLSVVPTSGRAEVVIGVSGVVSVQDFTLKSPDKIVVDITGAMLGMKGEGYDRVARGGIVDVRYSQYRKNIVRVVVTLDAPHRYTVARDSGGIRLAVDGANASFAMWQIGHQPAASSAPQVEPALAPVTVRTSTSAARNAAPPMVPAAVAVAPVSKEPVPELVNLPKAHVLPALLSQNASANPTVIQSQQPKRRVTVTWDNDDIRDVLAAFSAFSGRTIIPGKGIEGKVTANIVDQPWDVALRVVLNSNGLDAVEDPSGILIVDTQEHIALHHAAEPLTTRTLRLNYARALGLQPSVTARLSRDCSRSTAAGGGAAAAAPPPANGAAGDQGGASSITNMTCPVRGAVTVDSMTNSLSITDISENIDLLEKFTKDLDRRQPQVNIKAKIILVDRTALDALGLKYDLGGPNQFFNTLVPRLDSTGTPLTTTSQIFLGGNTLAAIGNASQSVPGAALEAVYSAAMGGFSLTSFIEALTTISLIDIQAEPSVTTLNNHAADLSSGTDFPVRVVEASTGANAAGGFPQATVSFKQTGVILEVTPQVTNDHHIQLTIHAENSSVQLESSDIGAVFPTQVVHNQLLVADGETTVVGGLTQTQVTISKSGIPLLVDLPILGHLFGYTTRQEEKTDLLILITPHIVDFGQDADGKDHTP